VVTVVQGATVAGPVTGLSLAAIAGTPFAQTGVTVSAVSNPQYADASGMTSFRLKTTGIGNLVIGFVQVEAPMASPVAALSSPHVSNWAMACQGMTPSGAYCAIWIGTTTAASATARVTMTFAASPGQSTVETGFQEFTSARTTPVWAVVAGGSQAASAGMGTVLGYPSLTPSSAGELYWGYGETAGVGTAGSTPGYFYAVTSVYTNVICWNLSASAGVQAPAAVSVTGPGIALGVLVTDNAVIVPPLHPAYVASHPGTPCPICGVIGFCSHAQQNPPLNSWVPNTWVPVTPTPTPTGPPIAPWVPNV
jgi:hypothetical protein